MALMPSSEHIDQVRDEGLTALAPKAAFLLALSARAPVPALVTLQPRDLRALWTNYDLVRTAAESILSRTKLTAAAYLYDDVAEIQDIVAGLEWCDEAPEFLIKALCQAIPHWHAELPLAIRSANTGEDLGDRSFAGLYRSHLDVCGITAIKAATVDVWASSYSTGAVVERLRSCLPEQSFSMSIILQEMVRAQRAGVAFSRDPLGLHCDPIVEWVEGSGDALVDGRVPANRARVGRVEGCDPILVSVANLLDEAAAYLECDADIEWAWDGQTTWLLQARPMTAGMAGPIETHAQFKCADLYGDDEAIHAIGRMPEFAQYFRIKRRPIIEFSRANGFAATRALVVLVNPAGLELPEAKSALEGFTTEHVLVDISDQFRQLLVPTSDLSLRLAGLLGSQKEPQVIVLREFVQGDIGLITQCAGTKSGELLGEFSTSGLLAMNRGVAGTKRFVMRSSGDTCPLSCSQDLASRMYQGAMALRQVLGPVQIEWVMQDEKLYPLDYSRLNKGSEAAMEAADAAMALGYCEGPIFRFDETSELEALSTAASISLTDVPQADELGPSFAILAERIRQMGSPPVIVTSRPLAVLAPLIPLAAGFVFEAGSVLCHLAILLREQGCPAAHSPELYQRATSCSAISLHVSERVTMQEITMQQQHPRA